MLMLEVSCYNYSIIVTAILLYLVLPMFGLSVLLLCSDIYLSTGYYDVRYGGDVILYQHLFWFFGHPEVYVLIIPAFGIVTATYMILTGSHVYGESIRIGGMSAIAYLGLVVWAHHMYTVTRELESRVYFTALTMCIAIPTGTKIYNYLVTSSSASFTYVHGNMMMVLVGVW